MEFIAILKDIEFLQGFIIGGIMAIIAAYVFLLRQERRFDVYYKDLLDYKAKELEDKDKQITNLQKQCATAQLANAFVAHKGE